MVTIIRRPSTSTLLYSPMAFVPSVLLSAAVYRRHRHTKEPNAGYMNNCRGEERPNESTPLVCPWLVCPLLFRGVWSPCSRLPPFPLSPMLPPPPITSGRSRLPRPS